MSLGSLGASVGSEGASQKWHFSWEAKEGAQWLWTYKKKVSGTKFKSLNVTEKTKQAYYDKWRKEDKSTRKLEVQTTIWQLVSLVTHVFQAECWRNQQPGNANGHRPQKKQTKQ